MNPLGKNWKTSTGGIVAASGLLLVMVAMWSTGDTTGAAEVGEMAARTVENAPGDGIMGKLGLAISAIGILIKGFASGDARK